ncbi:MAG: hypothetical protein A2W31_14670 [Planctomycetes bacterium RBG_16_64_10]|nr:MAG: hypothetical protein A2W31_14670 [Planctomycetes bacterium RBG_16_64_10]
MPIYEYSCATCRTSFELLVRDSETPRCPDCGGTRLERLLSVAVAHTAGRRDRPLCGGGPGAAPCGMGMGGCGLPECGL